MKHRKSRAQLSAEAADMERREREAREEPFVREGSYEFEGDYQEARHYGRRLRIGFNMMRQDND